MSTRVHRILEALAGLSLAASVFAQDPQPPPEALETTQQRTNTSPIWHSP